jgi:diguanylate cyclase (GGDEF)-like protein
MIGSVQGAAMLKAGKPANETERLAALQRYAILDTPAEAAYDDLLSVAAAICGTPMGTVSLVDADRQWFKSRLGVSDQQTPRDVAFCSHTILDPGHVFEVNDAATDARFSDSPLVTGDPNIRFYAGAPLVSSDGQAVGALCVMDTTPHQLTDQQRRALEALSRQVVALMELRTAVAELRHHLEEREWYERQLGARRVAQREMDVAGQTQTRIDALTGLANRRDFSESLKRALEEDGDMAFAIVDVDHFKAINDGWGHPFGDKVLVAVAEAVRRVVGDQGQVGRIGGEEFGVLLPGMNALQGCVVADDVRAAVRELEMGVPVTVSIGVTGRNSGERDEASEMYTRADDALSEAKRGGRDCVESA